MRFLPLRVNSTRSNVGGVVKTDASAALGIIQRQGLGKVRHIDTRAELCCSKDSGLCQSTRHCESCRHVHEGSHPGQNLQVLVCSQHAVLRRSCRCHSEVVSFVFKSFPAVAQTCLTQQSTVQVEPKGMAKPNLMTLVLGTRFFWTTREMRADAP